jgi:hypothetical protein
MRLKDSLNVGELSEADRKQIIEEANELAAQEYPQYSRRSHKKCNGTGILSMFAGYDLDHYVETGQRRDLLIKVPCSCVLNAMKRAENPVLDTSSCDQCNKTGFQRTVKEGVTHVGLCEVCTPQPRPKR